MNPQISPGAALHCGQTTTGAAAAITTKPASSNGRVSGKLVLKALAANSAAIYIGGDATVSAATGLQLNAGDPPLHLNVDDPSRVFAFSAVAQTLSWLWY